MATQLPDTPTSTEISVEGAGGPVGVGALTEGFADALVTGVCDDALGVVAAVETLKARLDAVALLAWAGLHAAYTQASTDAGWRRSEVESLAASGTVAEVMAATGLGEGECWRRLRLAVGEPERTATLLAALAAGAASLTRVLRVHDRTRDLPAADADEVARVALGPARDGSIPAEALVRRRVSRAIAARSTPQEAERRRAGALARRCASAEIHPDGVGSFTATGSSERVTAAMTRIDVLARRARAAGVHPGRSLAQLRSDITFDLLLHGRCGAPDNTSGAAHAAGPELDWARLGEPPAARVDVIVALSTLLGLDETPGELPGHGPVTADHARVIAHTAGSTWRRLVVDPVDGSLIELTTTSYQPPARLRAHITARDQVCRAPGCHHPAGPTDLDHRTPWPTGPTTTSNLDTLHRTHHRLKSSRLWGATHDTHTGALTWHTLTGRSYTTYPHDYLDTQRHTLGADHHHDHHDHDHRHHDHRHDDGRPPIDIDRHDDGLPPIDIHPARRSTPTHPPGHSPNPAATTEPPVPQDDPPPPPF